MNRFSRQNGYYGFEALGLITPILVTLVLGFSVLELGYLTSKVRSQFISSTAWYESPSQLSERHNQQALFKSSNGFEFDSLGFPIRRSGLATVDWSALRTLP